MQEKICNHLVRIKNIKKKNFLIGDEVFNDDSSRYFKISYTEVRTDQLVVQLTPMICDRKGFLKIDLGGTISLIDENFNSYCSSRIFYFDFQMNLLKSKGDEKLESVEKRSSATIKGLFSLGLFACGAAIVYTVATNNLEVDFKL